MIQWFFSMIHQPSGGARGQATDIQIQAEEIIKLKKQLNLIYVKHTKQTLEHINSSMERDNVRHINSICTFDNKKVIFTDSIIIFFMHFFSCFSLWVPMMPKNSGWLTKWWNMSQNQEMRTATYRQWLKKLTSLLIRNIYKISKL